MGVFPYGGLDRGRPVGLPHARGGVSIARFCEVVFHLSSPRPWGCFLFKLILSFYLFVFPTPVGVFLWRSHRVQGRVRLPHARGGVSSGVRLRSGSILSSPRPWGCFYVAVHIPLLGPVFPTPVGVFNKRHKIKYISNSLPHARGGVPLP